MNELRTICAEFPSTRVIGFLGHLQAELMEEARSIGVTEVLTRGQLAARLESVLRDNEPQGS
ncbi:MAG TPA: hypothetical protein VMK12_08925 [Anaeromyxobacteraceae bacterium]|nr:hypothetical protein [Anaeromyxobacteraceae bacterium]